MENSNKAPRITKAQRFEDIIALLNGSPATHGTTVADAENVLRHELELLAKKNSSDNKKQTDLQKRNKELKDIIFDYLMVNAPKSCTEINKEIPELVDYSNHKVASLLRSLVEEGLITRSKGKGGQSFFSVA